MQNTKETKAIVLWRDEKGPLKFNGERIGSATRHSRDEGDDQVMRDFETSAKLFRTSSGKYVLGIETYNRTDECYDSRYGWAGSLEEIAEKAKNFGDDLLAEVFEDTEIADRFVEWVD